MLKKYRLKDGSIYWHKLYYDIMPRFLTRYTPPLGSYNYAFYLVHPHQYGMDLYDQAKWFLQRGYRGYSDCDVWGWYSHVARINEAALRHLAKNKQGHPIGMTMEGWQTRLLKMADGFKAIQDEEEDFKSHKLPRRAYFAVHRERQQRLNRGLKLYQLHFQSLWD